MFIPPKANLLAVCFVRVGGREDIWSRDTREKKLFSSSPSLSLSHTQITLFPWLTWPNLIWSNLLSFGATKPSLKWLLKDFGFLLHPNTCYFRKQTKMVLNLKGYHNYIRQQIEDDKENRRKKETLKDIFGYHYKDITLIIIQCALLSFP